MKSLYDENAKYTSEALQLAGDASRLLSPLFIEWMEAGWSPRDIAHIIVSEATMIECYEIMRRDAAMYKKEKALKEESGK